MRTKMLLLPVVLLATSAAWAGEWTGYLMDSMCAPSMREKAASHTADCIRKCASSGFGIVTEDGAYLKFNEKGNALALNALDQSKKEERLEVKVSGKLASGMIRVETLEFTE